MIVFDKVCKTYESPYCEVLKDFSEHIRQGEFVCVTGESGSGKTTLLSMILKETNPTGGTISVYGKNIENLKKGDIPGYRSSIGMIFQDFRLIEDLNAYENVRLAYMLAGGRKKDEVRRITSVFSMLGINELHKRLPSEMSGGQQQKVCLARAIVNQPRLLLADEPTGNLDPKSSEEIYALFRLINMQNITIMMVTHDIEGIKAINNKRVISLDKE